MCDSASSEGSLTDQEYCDFLGAGSSELAADLLEDLGIEFRSQNPMEPATDRLEDLLTEL